MRVERRVERGSRGTSGRASSVPVGIWASSYEGEPFRVLQKSLTGQVPCP